MPHFADRLLNCLQARGTPLCVGLDPRYASLPLTLRQRHSNTQSGQAKAYEEFCLRVIDLVSPLVAVVKPQSAFFEALGPMGLEAMKQTIRYAKTKGLMVVLDAKRNDIASTATAYAEMAFTYYQADALTVNPYLGTDSIEPFLQVSRKCNAGLYVLVRTSNPGAGQFQDWPGGEHILHEHVARSLCIWGQTHMGACGYTDVGAVVGATSPKELAHLRTLMPNVPLLVPGYGAQGGVAQDLMAAFDDQGRGAIVNSSRAILFPYAPDEKQWEGQVEKATRQAIEELPRVR